MTKKSINLPNDDWVYNYTRTLIDTLNIGYEEKTAIGIACTMVSVRMDLEPFVGRVAALKARVSVSNTLGERFEVSVGIDQSLIPPRLQDKARKFMKKIN